MGPNRSRTILVGEDELEVRGYLQMALKCLGYSVELAQDGDEVISFLREAGGEVKAVLLDMTMPNGDGMETLRQVRELDPALPVIMISGAASTVEIVAAMKAGAADFLCKPLTHDDLRKAINRALERRGIDSEPPARAPSPPASFFAASNPRMREIEALVDHIGWSEAPVLIQGETGTGKEVLACELNRRSPRASKPFLKLNCAALPSELVESELFGYERGAFTGAFQAKAGLFENADSGTVLLDEIGDMDFRLQAKLLQVLQDSSFQRIGGKETLTVDVRIMAATHRDLEKSIRDGTFREDLYYRLNVINIYVPPLRERKEDIPGMAEFLLRKHGNGSLPTISSSLKDAILQYPWPGNIRELENVIRKLLIFRNPDAIAAELTSKSCRRAVTAAAHPGRTLQTAEPTETGPMLEQLTRANLRAEMDVILAALNSTRWNRKRAAALLKVDYKALLYKMKKLGIEGAGEGPAAAFSQDVN